MSKRIKLDLKNVTSGLQNLSELLPGLESIKHNNGFSRLVVPRSVPIHRPEYKYYQQDYFSRNILDLTKLAISAVPPEGAPKQITSKITPFSIKCLDTLNFDSIYAPAPGLPWGTSYHCYYDKSNPQCPPSGPTPCSGGEKKSPPIASPSKAAICPPPKASLPPKGDPCSTPASSPCGSRKSSTKKSPCGRKMSTTVIPLECKVPCGGSKGPPQRKKPDCGKGGGGAQRKKPDCGKGGAKKPKGSPCKPPSQKKKSPCGKGGKKPAKGGTVCPPAKAVKDCPPKSKGGGGKGSKCPPIKRAPSCGDKKSGGGPTKPPPCKKRS